MKIVFTLCILFSAITMNAQESIAGIWNTGQDNTKVEITTTDDIYNGKIVSSDNEQVKIGNLLLKDIKSVKGEWKGKLFAAKKGKWYNAILEEKAGKLLVKVKAGMVSKTLEWTKE